MAKRDRDAERAAALEEAQRQAESEIKRLSGAARPRATASPRSPMSTPRNPPSPQGQGFGPAPHNYGGALRGERQDSPPPPPPSPAATPGPAARWGAPSSSPSTPPPPRSGLARRFGVPSPPPLPPSDPIPQWNGPDSSPPPPAPFTPPPPARRALDGRSLGGRPSIGSRLAAQSGGGGSLSRNPGGLAALLRSRAQSQQPQPPADDEFPEDGPAEVPDARFEAAGGYEAPEAPEEYEDDYEYVDDGDEYGEVVHEVSAREATEIALQQLAGREGFEASPEDVSLSQVDVAAANQARDQALAQYQQKRASARPAGIPGADDVTQERQLFRKLLNNPSPHSGKQTIWVVGRPPDDWYDDEPEDA